MLPSGTVIILDTETGGLNAERNPLLSVGLMIATSEEILSTLSVKFTPPENTWLEVPIHADQLKGKYSKEIECWLNLTTGDMTKPREEKPARFISAVAAEVNGFVGASDVIQGWDLQKTKLWGQCTYAEGAAKIGDWIAATNLHDPGAVLAHNAQFDKDFMLAWLPEIVPILPETWVCTQKAFKDKFLGGKTKGSSLGAICKLANFSPTAEHSFHTELGDCAATHFIWGWMKGQGA